MLYASSLFAPETMVRSHLLAAREPARRPGAKKTQPGGKRRAPDGAPAGGGPPSKEAVPEWVIGPYGDLISREEMERLTGKQPD